MPTLLKKSDRRNNFSTELSGLEINRLNDRDSKVFQDSSNDAAIRKGSVGDFRSGHHMTKNCIG